MATKQANRIKNEDQYEALGDEGMSKEKAARIANTKNASKRGGKHPPYEQWTYEQLYKQAQKVGVSGRTKMNKAQLMKALREE